MPFGGQSESCLSAVVMQATVQTGFFCVSLNISKKFQVHLSKNLQFQVKAQVKTLLIAFDIIISWTTLIKFFIVLSLKHKGGMGFFLHVLCVCSYMGWGWGETKSGSVPPVSASSSTSVVAI